MAYPGKEGIFVYKSILVKEINHAETEEIRHMDADAEPA